MHGLIDWIERNNNKKTRRVLAIVALFAYILMGTKLLWILKDFDTSYMMDLKLFYSGPYFISTLADITELQAGYYQIIHFIDYLFIFTFYPFLVLTLLINIYNISKNYIIVPIVAMICDFLENILIDFHLHVGISQTLGGMVGILSFVKFFAILVSLVLISYQAYLSWRQTRE